MRGESSILTIFKLLKLKVENNELLWHNIQHEYLNPAIFVPHF